MSYGKINLREEQREVIRSLLADALFRNKASIADAADENELCFYRSFETQAMLCLTAIDSPRPDQSFSEDQLTLMKGLVPTEALATSKAFAEAIASKNNEKDVLGNLLLTLESLSAVLDAPFVTDNSQDAVDDDDDENDEDD